MEAGIMNKQAMISDQRSALRFTGDVPVTIDGFGAENLGQCFTIEAWVRPSSPRQGVVLFSKDRFEGTGVAFGPGRYDDLSRFRCDARNIQSIRIPPGFEVVLFTGKNCTGEAHPANNDVISEGQKCVAFQSLLVIDLHSKQQSHAVIYKKAGFKGDATVLELRRYEALTFLSSELEAFASIQLPPGLELVLYDQSRCHGTALTLTKSVTDIGEWTKRVRSLSLMKSVTDDLPVVVTARSDNPRHIQIFVAESGHGLELDIKEPPSAVHPELIQFSNTTLRLDRWQHLALTCDGKHVHSFLNGRVVNTRTANEAFDFTGQWTMGKGFYGDIGLLRLHSAALPPKALSAQRFKLPPMVNVDENTVATDTALFAAWVLSGDGTDPLMEFCTNKHTQLPEREVFWVSARFPRSILQSGLAHLALSQVTQRSNEAQHKIRQEGQAALETAKQKAQQQRREAHNLAQANAHAVRFENIRSINAGAMVKTGRDGKALAEPLGWDNSIYTDITLDAKSGYAYLGYRMDEDGRYEIHRFPHPKQSRRPEILFSREQAIHSLTIKSSGDNDTGQMFWIEGAGTLCTSLTRKGSDVSILLSSLVPGGEGEWHLTYDAANERLLWSNGREIWTGKPTDDGRLSGIRVLVSHGVSPQPVALVVDSESGDIFWIDKALEKVRTCGADASGVRDLYEALDPREGIALDYFDLSKFSDKHFENHEQVTKRVFWNAEYKNIVEAAVIDNPGMFCWLQHMEGQARPQNNIPALDDVRFVATRWCEPEEKPVRISDSASSFALRYYKTADGHLHALTGAYQASYDGGVIKLKDIDLKNGDSKTLFTWYEDRFGSLGQLMAIDPSGGRFLHSSGIGASIIPFDSFEGQIGLKGQHPGDEYGRDRGSIEALAFSADGKLAILGSRDNTISVWDSTSGECLHILEGHSLQIQTILPYEKEGKQYALSGSYDNTIRNWDLSTGECLITLKGHTHIVTGIDINSDCTRIVTSSFDQTLKLWDLASGSCLRTFSGHANVVWSVVLQTDGNRMISSSVDKTLKIWDVETGVCLRTLEGHQGSVFGGIVHDKGRHLLSIGEDFTLQWDLHRHPWVLSFDGELSHIDLGPLHLNFEQGFSVELQILPELLEDEMTLFDLGNGDDGDNLTLTVNAQGRLSFAIEKQGRIRRIESDGRENLQAGVWSTVSLTVNSEGDAAFEINGDEAGKGQIHMPRTCLRIRNKVGCSNRQQVALFKGAIGMLRLWNRTLSSVETESFHQQPLSAPVDTPPSYDRSMMEYRDGRPYLMSGLSDGSTPPVPMFELAVDKGLGITSKSSAAHAELMIAQHAKQKADEEAATKRATARQATKEAINAAHARNKASHSKAKNVVDDAHTETRRERETAHQNLANAHSRARDQLATANSVNKQKRELAKLQAQKIKDVATQKAETIKTAANKNLSAAQNEKVKHQARR